LEAPLLAAARAHGIRLFAGVQEELDEVEAPKQKWVARRAGQKGCP